MRYFVLPLLAGVMVASASFAADKQYGPGVSDTEIKIGQTMPYSGPASAYGVYGIAEAAYFKMLNDHGGVNGRKITLISLDNAYMPPKALEGVRRLVDEEHVLAIMGNFGTPTSIVIRQFLKDAHVPNLFVVSGSAVLNDPRRFPWTVPLVAQYRTEARIYADYIVQERPAAKLAVLYQDDDLGKDYLAGLRAGLGDAYAKMVVATASYEVTDLTVDSQIVALHGSGADVLMDFVTPKFAAAAMRKVYDVGWRPLHIIALTGTSDMSALHAAGAEKAAGIITTTNKQPSDPAWADDPDIKAYHAFLTAYYPSADPDSNLVFSGYSAATLYAEVLRRCGDELTRQHLVDVVTHLEGVHMPFLIPGNSVDYSPTNYDALRRFQLARYDGAHLVLLGGLRSE